MESISLTSLAAELLAKLAEAQQSHSGRAAHTIHGGHTHELRQTVLALLAGHDLSEHDSPGEATLQVLQGQVRLTVGADAWDGKTGDYVAIPHERHALHAVEDSVVMLTVLKTIPGGILIAGPDMLSTPWSRSLGLQVPIVNAPMGGVAGGRLAAAVTAAGGLGMVGMGSAGSRAALKTQLQHVSGTFGIGLVDWVMRNEAGLLDDALAARPVLLSVSFGTDWSWVGKAHDAGITTATQVYDSEGARRAVDAGIDVLVARGAEGGGHGDVRLGTLPLLDTVLDVVSVPVLAGGGIASARSLAAVLAAGASGAWVGTRLAACPEALTGDGSRRALIAARATDTTITRVFDVAQGRPWPERFPARVLANDFVERWTGREDALAADQPARQELAASITADDRRIAPVDAGQGVGMIGDDASVGEVIETMCSGAEKLLSAWGSR